MALVVSTALTGCSLGPAARSASQPSTPPAASAIASATVAPASTAAPATETPVAATDAAPETPVPAPTGDFSLSTTLPATEVRVLSMSALHGGLLLLASVSQSDGSAVLAWTSPDGLTWTEVTPSGLEGGYQLHLAPTQDGRVVAFGPHTRDGEGAGVTSWIASDASSWREVDLRIPGDISFGHVAAGALGAAALGETSYRSTRRIPGSWQVWLARDGLDWQPVYEISETPISRVARAVGVGPEGVVAVGGQGGSGEGPFLWAAASADGLTWYEADPNQGGVRGAPQASSVVPLGGDWLTLGLDYDDPAADAAVSRSANGLDWAPAAMVDLGDLTEMYQSPFLIGDGRLAILVLADGPAGSGALTRLWLSRDGTAWEQVTATARDGVVAQASTGTRSVLAAYTSNGVEIWTAGTAP